MNDFVVPDMTEPIVAWRSWHFRGGDLLSLNRHNIWPKMKHMEAACNGSEPSTRRFIGWEANPWIGDPVWVRDALENEQLEHEPPQSYRATSSMMAYVTVPTFTLEPLPESPSALLLPQGWTWRIGYREQTFPPRHTESPSENCGCGIYAVKDRKNVLSYGGDVFGEVYLWGRVIEGEKGYRAQYAYPKELYSAKIKKVKGEVRDGLLEYGVPLDKHTAEPVPEAGVIITPGPWWKFW